jgi:hypothetical protein
MGIRRPSIKKDLTASPPPLSGLGGLIDIDRFWKKRVGEGVIYPESLHSCINCRMGQAVVTPKTNGDWFFSCLSCHTTWNLYQHLHKSGAVLSREERAWLIGNGVVKEEEVDQYIAYSKKISLISDLLQESDGDILKTFFPMESVSLSPQKGARLCRILGLSNTFVRKNISLAIAIYRDCFGTMSKLAIYRASDVHHLASVVLINGANHFHCTGGSFKVAGKVYVASSLTLTMTDINKLAHRSHVLTSPNNKASMSVYYPLPWVEPPIEVTIVSTVFSVDQDMQLFGALFNLRNTRVVILNEAGDKIREDSVINTLFRSNCYLAIKRGFARSKDLSSETAREIEEDRWRTFAHNQIQNNDRQRANYF